MIPGRGPFDHVIERRPESPFVPARRLPFDPGSVPGAMSHEMRQRISEMQGRVNGNFQAFGFLAQQASAQILPQQPGRYYFFIVNNSAASQIYVGFDADANIGNGLVLDINYGFYEPWIVPTNAIHVSAQANNTPGYLIAVVL